MMDETDFESHGVNKDASLGSKPPFLAACRLARTALYETVDGDVHMRLFDGRPGSENFTGLTPSEAVEIIREESEIVWGCFLDPGQTARLNIRTDGGVQSFGNRHYLRWPRRPDEKYVWLPEHGRPVASIVEVR
jgi:hypothetical protein